MKNGSSPALFKKILKAEELMMRAMMPAASSNDPEPLSFGGANTVKSAKTLTWSLSASMKGAN